MNASKNNLPNKLRMTSSGFTLIELMVTIAVLAIIVGIAAPSISTQLAQGQVKATSTLIQTSIARAKAESAISRSTVTWAYSGTNNDITLRTGSIVVASYSLSDSGVLTFNPATATTLLISKEGMITMAGSAANVTVNISDSRIRSVTKRIQINSKRAFECSGNNC